MTQLHDSGMHERFPTGAQRDNQNHKPRIDLISPIFLGVLGDWMARGAKKYAARNWEKGIDNERCMASLMRHLNQYREGQRDEDHLAAVSFNLMAIIHNLEMVKRGLLPAELDNLPTYVKHIHRLYLAGPMRGYPRYNFDAFEEAAVRWRSAGWEVVSPAEMDLAMGFNPDTDTPSEDFIREAMLRDLAAIEGCTAIVMLKGWEKSEGARTEYARARRCGLVVYEDDDGVKVVE